MTTTEADKTEFKMQVMMTFNAPLHTHVGSRPGKEHLGRLFHGYIDNKPQRAMYHSYCGRLNNIRTMECSKQGHERMATCKDCQRKVAKLSMKEPS